MSAVPASERPKVSLLYNPRVRTVTYQLALCAVIAFLAWSAVTNAIENLRRAHIASGFEFWSFTSGFDISQSLINYTSTSTYGRAFWVGLFNTLLVAGLGVVLATIVGFLAGIARLSKNWLLARIAGGYVELIRNLPLLLQLLFWYNAVLKALPEMRDSLTLPGGGFLNNRGLFLPQPTFLPGFEAVVAAFVIGLVAAIAFRIWARRRQERTGQQAPVGWVALGLVVGLPVIVYLLAGSPVTLTYPEKGRFNISGGLELLPELVALLFGLVLYTGAFIAEVVRAGILAVAHGQTEAAYSLGLRPGPTLRLVVIPQAMRVIIPPLTNQYLNLTKNSSLAVFVGYPDLVQVFAGTVLNQTGQAVEVIAVTMAVYLTISLVTSLAMNWYNSRIALVER
ncbi:MAG TPA: amino acid ABC transporter permease [Xanthobacteraceae bacterium]|jgi:general L-amino acid transport system permease protein|nr:amino acid ABC transporter permease [Xanthobacteraceae bacterium]